MDTSLEQLASRGSAALCARHASEEDSLGSVAALLSIKNGFFAYASALRVRGAGRELGSLEDWNRQDGWRSLFPVRFGSDLIFFAEDAFGNQFGCRRAEQAIWRLEAETGELSEFAPNISTWAARMLLEHREETAWPLAADWQKRFGPLPAGHRLVPRHPFVLGGEYDTDNLRALPDEEAMLLYARLARAIHDVPDGERVRVAGFY